MKFFCHSLTLTSLISRKSVVRCSPPIKNYRHYFHLLQLFLPRPSPRDIFPPPAAVLEQNLKPSELFDGIPDLCGGLLLQCKLAFKRAHMLYSSDLAKVSHIIDQLKEDTLRWAHSYMGSHLLNSLTFSMFLD